MAMRVALVHEQLTQHGGSEEVFQAIAELFPESPIYTPLYYPDAVSPYFRKRVIHQSYVRGFTRLPLLHNRWRHFMPFFPRVFEQFDFRGFDAVVSSSSGFAKSIVTPRWTFHLCYCHSPARYLWVDPASYVREYPAAPVLKWVAPYFLYRIRPWDRTTASRPTVYVANSRNVQKRIKKFYERSAEVLYPPVAVDAFRVGTKKDFFLTGGRLVAYKRFDIAVKAFNKLGIPLVVFGTGPEEKHLKSAAKKNITFVGRISAAEKAELFAGAQGFLYPQEEDWGITAVESLASGTPVIALNRGGALETITPERGLFFHDQTWESLANAVIHFDPTRYDPQKLREYTLQFSPEKFKEKFMNIFNQEYRKFDKNRIS